MQFTLCHQPTLNCYANCIISGCNMKLQSFLLKNLGKKEQESHYDKEQL